MPLFSKSSKTRSTGILVEGKRFPQGNPVEISPVTLGKSNDFASASSDKEEFAANAHSDNGKRHSQSIENHSLNGRVDYGENIVQSSPRASFRSPTPPPPADSVKTIKGGNPMCRGPPPPQDSKLVFRCQLAHGGPAGLLYGFTNLRELYERAAECYEIPVDDILYCTVNTHKVDMDHLLGGQIGLDDFIFVHLKGQKKEIEIIKEESSLGVTITDNGAGKAFIKRIKSASVIGRLNDIIHAGDHVERINGDVMIGRKHYDVAKYLKDLPVGCSFTLRVIEPLKAASMSSRSSATSPSSSVSNEMFLPADSSRTKTLRFKAKGKRNAVLIESGPSVAVIDRMNAILESYLGIHDSELAWSVWDLAKEQDNFNNPVTFLSAFRRSDLAEFQIPDEVVFDLWAATRDSHYVTSRHATVVPFDSTDDEKTLTRPSCNCSNR